MIYINNTINKQEVWIPKNNGQGIPHKPSTKLEIGNITVTADTQTNYPSSGYIGFSSVVIDSSEYAQHNYDLGYSEGENDGYVSGVTDGEQSIIDTFTSTTITENGQYGSSAHPYSSVTVDVAQTGYTDQELQEAYNSGYTSGETHQKSLLVSTAITQNGSYSRENGYSAITVNVPTGQTYNIEANHSFTATTNGNYTIKPSDIWSITYDHTFARRYDFTINGTIPQSFVNDTAYVVRYYDEITEEEPIVIIKVGSGNTLYLNKNGWDEDDYGDVYFRLYQGKYRLEFDNDDLDSSEFSIIPYSNGEKYDVMSAVTLSVNVPSSSGGSEDFAKMIDRSITEVVIPSGVTKIGNNVFYDCTSLSSVTIPNSVTSIGNGAFCHCRSLSSVTIPNGVTVIGNQTFDGCTSLSSVTIPSGVTKLETSAFSGCSSLSSVTLPNTCRTIGNYVFSSCTSLSSVTIQSTEIRYINFAVFSNCTSLTNIYISATTAPTIYGNTFQGVPSTGTVHYPQGSDYSSWQSNTYLSGWTFIADL